MQLRKNACPSGIVFYLAIKLGQLNQCKILYIQLYKKKQKGKVNLERFKQKKINESLNKKSNLKFSKIQELQPEIILSENLIF